MELKLSKKTVIFDLDGTLADIEVRRKKAIKPNGKMDWDEFFNPDNIKLDKPIPAIVDLIRTYDDKGFKVVIFSGRNDRSWDETKDWPVSRNNPATPDMRFMPDEILKKKMLDTFVDIDDVLFVVDDRQKVVDMWRDLGLVVLQPAPGNF